MASVCNVRNTDKDEPYNRTGWGESWGGHGGPPLQLLICRGGPSVATPLGIAFAVQLPPYMKKKKLYTAREHPAHTNGDSFDEHIARNVEAIIALDKDAKTKRTRSELVADAIAKFCGSVTFVWLNALFFLLWILINTIPGIDHIDPFPFTFLTLVLSVEAIFLSTFILISQNLASRIAERRNHLDLQINLLSEQENTQMIALLEAIAEKVGADISNVTKVEVLREEMEPERIAEEIEQREEKT